MLLAKTRGIALEPVKRLNQNACQTGDMYSGESKVQCWKEQYCIGICEFRSMNQVKLVFKQDMVRVNTDTLGIKEI